MEKLINILCVGVGGFVGSVLRYIVSLWTEARGWTALPWGTLIVNVLGCFLITFIMTIAFAITMRPNLRLFLTTGVMGGLTTYSTFNYDTTKFFQAGAPAAAIANIAVTLVACFIAGLLGIGIARALVPE